VHLRHIFLTEMDKSYINKNFFYMIYPFLHQEKQGLCPRV